MFSETSILALQNPIENELITMLKGNQIACNFQLDIRHMHDEELLKKVNGFVIAIFCFTNLHFDPGGDCYYSVETIGWLFSKRSQEQQ